MTGRRPRARHRAESARTARLIVARRIALPEDVVFGALVDVPAQARWMVATRVRVCCGGSAGEQAGRLAGIGEATGAVDDRYPVWIGAKLVARTGFGRWIVDDSMRVSAVEPVRRWRVQHTGETVRGWGEFGVLPRDGGCLAYWAEEFELPGGVAGRFGWIMLGWVIRLGITVSLARLNRGLRSGSLIGTR